ncbi:hypothetical protein [Neobacillus muris]|nr:hypothetical protein [Neobacillus muris]
MDTRRWVLELDNTRKAEAPGNFFEDQEVQWRKNWKMNNIGTVVDNF